METELVVIMEMEMENTTMAKKEEDTTITTTTVIHMMSLNPKWWTPPMQNTMGNYTPTNPYDTSIPRDMLFQSD